MRIYFKISVVILFFLSLYSCTKEDDYSDNQKVVAKLDELTDLLISQKKVPGLIISINAPQKRLRYLRAKGSADLFTHKPMNFSNLYRTGSLTKTFTGTIILELIEEGKLKLNDKISSYLPELPYSEIVSVKQILNMTSGYYEYSMDEYYKSEFSKNPLKKWQPIELVNIALSHPLNFIPGTKWDYSNTNTIIAGLIIEKITSNSFKTEIENRIIKRYGLSNTFFPDDANMPTGKQYCHGYNSNINGIEDVSSSYDPSFAWAAGSLITNINDISVWLKMQLGSVILNPLLQFQRMNWVQMGDNDGYGLALMKVGNGFIGHSGGIPGYSSVSLYQPQSGISVIIMFNIISNNPLADIPRAIDFFKEIEPIAFQELK